MGVPCQSYAISNVRASDDSACMAKSRKIALCPHYAFELCGFPHKRPASNGPSCRRRNSSDRGVVPYVRMNSQTAFFKSAVALEQALLVIVTCVPERIMSVSIYAREATSEIRLYVYAKTTTSFHCHPKRCAVRRRSTTPHDVQMLSQVWTSYSKEQNCSQNSHIERFASQSSAPDAVSSAAESRLRGVAASKSFWQ